MLLVKQKWNIIIISPPHIGPDLHIVQDCASVRGGIYPDDLLLFPLQLDELPSTRASGAAAVGLTTTPSLGDAINRISCLFRLGGRSHEMIRTTSTLLQRLNRYLKQSGSSSGYDVNQTNSYVYEILQQLDRSKSSWIFSSPALLYFFCRKSKIHLPYFKKLYFLEFFCHIPF